VQTAFFAKSLEALERASLKYIRGRHAPESLGIQLDITNHCNLKCSHCYHPHHDNEGAIGLEEWFAILRQYKALLLKLDRTPSIILCGGEPTTSPSLNPLLTFIRDTFGACPVSILTNGTTLRPSLVARLAPWGARYQVSIDGHDAHSHDAVRGQGNFKRALQGIENLQAAGQQVSVLAILSRRTSAHLLAFFEMAQTQGIKELNFVRLVAEGAGASLVSTDADAPLLGLELKTAYERIIALSRQHGIRTNTAKPLYAAVEPGLGGHYRYQGIVVDYRGQLKVSSRAPLVLGNVLEEGLEALYLKNPILRAIRESKVEGCGSCTFLSRCGGDRNAAYAATGSFLARDPGCWIPTQMNEA
jgi:AdoMet-dependent heme synthase